MKRVHLLPNVITAFSLTCGLFAIFKMSMVQAGAVTEPILFSTALIMILAAFADLLDGWTARVMKAESEFGGFFDSLADAVTFGVAPPVIILKTLSIEPGSELSFLLTTAAMIYSVCGILRLVRFNVSQQLAKTNTTIQQDNQKNFTGLPIPGAAAAAISLNLFLSSTPFVSLNFTTKAGLLFGMLIFLGYLMVCRLKFPSLKTLRLRVASFRLVLGTVITAAIFFYGVLNYFGFVFFLISWFYVVAALVLSFLRMIYGKRSQTLIDYEPDVEEEVDLSEESD